jgi:hypothetical protein
MSNPNFNKQALIQDLYKAAEQVGPTKNSVASARTINQAINPFRQYITGPQKNSQSIGIYLLDQLSSYRGDSQAVKMLQEGYKFIQEPLVNDAYAVVKDYVDNKPDIPTLMGNVAMVTSQVPPPAGPILTGVAATIGIIASLLGNDKPPIPPPTAEDLINRDFMSEMVGFCVRDMNSANPRWIFRNEARTNELANTNNLTTLYIGKKYMYPYIKKIFETKLYGQVTQNPQRPLTDSGEYGLTYGNHTKDIDQYALENKVRSEQGNRYLWWLLFVFASMNEYWRGRMLGESNEEKWARSAYFLSRQYYSMLLQRHLQTMTYYQKLVDVIAFITGKTQAFYVHDDGVTITNLNPQSSTFDFGGKSPQQILALYIPDNNNLRAQIQNRINQLRGEGKMGIAYVSRPLIESAGAVFDLTNLERRVILKALRYGVLDVPQNFGDDIEIPNFSGISGKQGALYEYLLRFAYSALPCYIENVGVPEKIGVTEKIYPNLYTFKGIYTQHATSANGFNQWSGKIKDDFKAAIDTIRGDEMLFKMCLFRKAVLQKEEINRGVYVKDFLNDISVSDLKAEFPNAAAIINTITELRARSGIAFDDKKVIQTWYYYTNDLPPGLTEDEIKQLGGLLEDTTRNSAGGDSNLAKVALIGAGALVAKKAGVI